jgi:hypothetical protein
MSAVTLETILAPLATARSGPLRKSNLLSVRKDKLSEMCTPLTEGRAECPTIRHDGFRVHPSSHVIPLNAARPMSLPWCTLALALTLLLVPGTTRGQVGPPAAPGSALEQFRTPTTPDPGEPSLDQLIETIRRLPGGAERLEQAQLAGARLPGLTGIGARAVAVPRERARGATAPVAMPSQAGGGFSVTLTPLPLQRHSEVAYLQIWGAIIHVSTKGAILSHPAEGSSTLVGPLRSTRQHPYALIQVNIPQEGWYIVNMRGYQMTSSVSLVHAQHGNAGEVVQAWRYTVDGTWTWESFPALLRLSPGWHNFSFVSTGGIVDVVSVSVKALE